MNIQEAIEILKQHQIWRRGAETEMTNITNLGVAIDTILAHFDTKFQIGDKVCKPEGYSFDGVVLGAFKTTTDKLRYAVELEYNNMIHLFNEGQLELRNQL